MGKIPGDGFLGLVGGGYLLQSRAWGSLRGERRDSEETGRLWVVGFFFVIFGCVGSLYNLCSCCGVRGLLSIAVCRLLIVVPSLFLEHRL